MGDFASSGTPLRRNNNNNNNSIVNMKRDASGSAAASRNTRVGGRISARIKLFENNSSIRPDSAIKIQSWYRMVRQRRRYKSLLPVERTRVRIIEEILSTEITYVDALALLETAFIRPLKDNHSILDANSVKTIFKYLSDILNVNKQLLSSLQDRIEQYKTKKKNMYACCIGDIFVQLAPFFKVYQQFIRHHDNAMDIYNKCFQNSKQFQQFVESTITSHTKGQNFASLMITPIQRIPRYVLLLKQLVEHTQKDSKDYNYLSTSLQNMQEIAMIINESKRDQEQLSSLKSVHSKITNNYLEELNAPHRRFICEISVLKKAKNKFHRRPFLIFNDILVYAVPSNVFSYGSKVKAKLIMNLVDIKIRDLAFIAGPGHELHFQLLAPQKTFYLATETAEEKDKFINELSAAIVAAHEKTSRRRTRFRRRDAESYGWKHSFVTGTIYQACKEGDEETFKSLMAAHSPTHHQQQQAQDKAQAQFQQDQPQPHEQSEQQQQQSQHMTNQRYCADLINTPDQEKLYPLHLAVANGRHSITAELIQNNADLNVTDDALWTPLHWAAFCGDLVLVEMLVNNGAIIDALDDQNRTPAYLACAFNHVACLDYLLYKGANVNHADDTSFTLLHTAAQLKHLEVLEIILKYNPDVNAKNVKMRTALHYACSNEDLAMVKCLIDAGASLNLRDINAELPVHFSTLHPSIADSMLRMLVSHGARLEIGFHLQITAPPPQTMTQQPSPNNNNNNIDTRLSFRMQSPWVEIDKRWYEESCTEHLQAVYKEAAKAFEKRSDKDWDLMNTFYANPPPSGSARMSRTKYEDRSFCYQCSTKFGKDIGKMDTCAFCHAPSCSTCLPKTVSLMNNNNDDNSNKRTTAQKICAGCFNFLDYHVKARKLQIQKYHSPPGAPAHVKITRTNIINNNSNNNHK